MPNNYYISKRYYIDSENYIERYWNGDGFSMYKATAKKYANINMASDIAYMLRSIANIQDEQSVKYVIHALRNNTLVTCMEVNDD